jgi:hypothetical protein
VARGAVGIEDSFAVSDISSKRRSGGNDDSSTSSGGSFDNLMDKK